MLQSHYNELGLSMSASKEEVKKKYKEIALTCHPDKLLNIKDENEKNAKIEKFKTATIAYNKIMNGNSLEDYEFIFNNDFTHEDYLNEFGDFNWTSEIFKMFTQENSSIFMNIASNFANNKIYPKSYYQPAKATKIISHDITLPVTYNEVKNNAKKKLRLVLVKIEEPVFIDMYCGSFPVVKKTYIDDNNEEHEITITMEFKANELYSHIINNNIIDLIITIDINLIEYLSGVTKKIKYIDKKDIIIDIPAFQKDYFEISDMGINGGSLIVNLTIEAIEENKWNNLTSENKDEMIRILRTIF